LNARGAAHRAVLRELAANRELEASQKYQQTTVETELEKSKKSIVPLGDEAPNAVGELMKGIDQQIDASLFSDAKKADLKKQYRESLETTGFLSQSAQKQQEVAALAWGTSKAGHAGNAALHGIIDAAAKASGIDPAFYRQLIRIESGGNPQAEKGKYKGLTQLPDDEFKKYGGGNIFDPADNANAGARRLAVEIKDFTARTGRPPTPTEIYLQHQQGVGGLQAHEARPDAPAWQNMAGTAEGRDKGAGWAKQAIWGNMTDEMKAKFPGGVETVSSKDFMGLWKNRVDTKEDPRFSNISTATRMQLGGQADTAVAKEAARQSDMQTKLELEQLNDLKSKIDAGAANDVDVKFAQQSWLRDADTAKQLFSRIEQRDAQFADSLAAHAAHGDANKTWNGYDKEDRKMVEILDKAMGSTPQSLEHLANHTGMVVPSRALAMFGIVSNSTDANKVQAALETMAKLAKNEKYPNIFAGLPNAEKLTDYANQYHNYVVDRGLPAAEATRLMMEQINPPDKAKPLVKYKPEEIREVIKKNLQPNDVRAFFDDSFLGWRSNPETFNPQMAERAYGDYQENFRDIYSRNGDVDQSKKLALQAMKLSWDVTEVNGGKAIMKWAPDKAPVYRNIENVPERIAKQAIEDIKTLKNVDVERKDIRLQEISSTGEDHINGKIPHYVLSYKPKDGPERVIPGQWFADPKKMLADQNFERAEQTAKNQAAARVAEEQRLLITPDQRLTPKQKDLKQSAATPAPQAEGQTPGEILGLVSQPGDPTGPNLSDLTKLPPGRLGNRNMPEFKDMEAAAEALRKGRIQDNQEVMVGGKRTKVYFNPDHRK
jgi:hypothetical protein